MPNIVINSFTEEKMRFIKLRIHTQIYLIPENRFFPILFLKFYGARSQSSSYNMMLESLNGMASIF